MAYVSTTRKCGGMFRSLEPSVLCTSAAGTVQPAEVRLPFWAWRQLLIGNSTLQHLHAALQRRAVYLDVIEPPGQG
jgi:hypothetical protein